MTSKFKYEKPEIAFWTDEELDAIEATMSRGEGGIIYIPIAYDWRDHWTMEVDNETLPVGAALIVNALFVIATRGMSWVAGLVLSSIEIIAAYYYEQGLLSAWYTREQYNLYMRDGFSNGQAIWSYVGCLVTTTFYGNASHTWYVGKTGYHSVPPGAEYMLGRIT